MKTRIIALLFAMTVVAQLWVPASMIYSSEKILISGKAIKFRTAPVDPYDAFRGKYVALQFVINRIDSSIYAADLYGDRQHLSDGRQVVVILAEDSCGFAKAIGVRRYAPEQGCFVKAKINRIDNGTMIVDYPFSKFFLEEGKAGKAEELYRQQNRTGKQNSYVMVRVDVKGNAVIEDLVLGGISVKESLR